MKKYETTDIVIACIVIGMLITGAIFLIKGLS